MEQSWWAEKTTLWSKVYPQTFKHKSVNTVNFSFWGQTSKLNLTESKLFSKWQLSFDQLKWNLRQLSNYLNVGFFSNNLLLTATEAHCHKLLYSIRRLWYLTKEPDCRSNRQRHSHSQKKKQQSQNRQTIHKQDKQSKGETDGRQVLIIWAEYQTWANSSIQGQTWTTGDTCSGSKREQMIWQKLREQAQIYVLKRKPENGTQHTVQYSQVAGRKTTANSHGRKGTDLCDCTRCVLEPHKIVLLLLKVNSYFMIWTIIPFLYGQRHL